jgi:hypothetical protein
MQLRALAVLLPASLLVLTGCRQPTPTGEEAFDAPPDTAVVSDPMYDPEGFAGEWETSARTVILRDESVRDAQVILVDDVVRITAALAPGATGELPDEGVLRLKAQQFVLAAMREIERPGVTTGTDMLAPTRHPYHVSLRGTDGETLYEAEKPAAASDLVEVEGTAGGAPSPDAATASPDGY